MRCSLCGAHVAPEDSYCRRCGVARRPSRLPVKRTSAPPTLWRQATPALAQGAALVAAGLAAEWLLRTAARNAVKLPLSLLGQPKPAKNKAISLRRGESLPEGIVAISETVVMRRTIFRR